MRTKPLIFIFALMLLISSLSFAQTDSAKTYKVKGTNLVIGKYYIILFPIKPAEKGKLLAVNKSTILMLIDNGLEEFEIDDIEKMQSIEADNILYTSHTAKVYKPVYSLSAGYTQRDNGRNSSYYNSSGSPLKFNGFNVSGDALIKTSDNFGFRFDLSYAHTFGRRLSNGSNQGYDSSTYSYETAYGSMNLFAIRTGLLFGAMSPEEAFNFYICLGLGFGWSIRGEQISYSYITKNNVTTTNSYKTSNEENLLFGVHAHLRLSYKISSKYNLFIEPSVQYWTTDINRLLSINGGITFRL